MMRLFLIATIFLGGTQIVGSLAHALPNGSGEFVLTQSANRYSSGERTSSTGHEMRVVGVHTGSVQRENVDGIRLSLGIQAVSPSPNSTLTQTPTNTQTGTPIITQTLTPTPTISGTMTPITPTQTLTECPGIQEFDTYDLVEDGSIDALDLLQLLDRQAEESDRDFNCDSEFDGTDLILFSSHWREESGGR